MGHIYIVGEDDEAPEPEAIAEPAPAPVAEGVDPVESGEGDDIV